MARRDPEHENTTLRIPPKRVPEAETLRIARFAQPSEPRALVAQRLDSLSDDETTVDRYRTLEVLGRGGMGEVTRAYDLKIGREVALKTMQPVGKADQAQATSRFLREARVQALLEHPAIVPVYDISTDEGGPSFTMKRVRGETLFEIMERSRSIKTSHGIRHSRHKLLSAFVSVCWAVHYAHENGVVHRDLKPDNIMLGSHGEVYVLDWGVARVITVGGVEITVTEPSDDTMPGDMVGTPGFMAPEQVLGQLDLVDAKSDVFALGAILYELITLEPMIDGADARKILENTLNPDRQAAPPRDMPPELYVLALHATRFLREERLASARELAEAVDRYLDGDRDLVQRKKLASQHAEKARELSNAALDGPPAGREEARASAMREAGKALGFLPDFPAARAVVLRLLATPPSTLPASAKGELDRLTAAQIVSAMRDNAVRSAIWVAMLPLLVLLGPRLPWLLGVVALVVGSCAALAWFFYLKRVTHSNARLVLAALVSVLTVTLSGVFGPLVFVPGFAAVNTMLFAAQGAPRHRVSIVVIGCASFLLPLVLELAGLIPRAMAFDDGAIHLIPRLTHFPELGSTVALLAVSVIGVVIPAIVATRLRDAAFAAEEKLLIHKWHLEQLAPKT